MYINTIYGIAKEEDTLDGLLHPDIYAEDGTTDRFGAQYSEYSDAECYNADLSALLHELGPFCTELRSLKSKTFTALPKKELQDAKTKYFAKKLELAKEKLEHITAENFTEDGGCLWEIKELLFGIDSYIIHNGDNDSIYYIDQFIRSLEPDTQYHIAAQTVTLRI